MLLSGLLEHEREGAGGTRFMLYSSIRSWTRDWISDNDHFAPILSCSSLP